MLKGSIVFCYDLFINDVLYVEVVFDMCVVRFDFFLFVFFFWYGFFFYVVFVFYVDIIMLLNNYLYIVLVFFLRSLFLCVLYICI